MAAYWVASIERMVCGAIREGVGEDQVYDAVCKAIQESNVNGRAT
jgi:hypothetical protein